jgi:hypothetical protein
MTVSPCGKPWAACRGRKAQNLAGEQRSGCHVPALLSVEPQTGSSRPPPRRSCGAVPSLSVNMARPRGSARCVAAVREAIVERQLALDRAATK